MTIKKRTCSEPVPCDLDRDDAEPEELFTKEELQRRMDHFKALMSRRDSGTERPN